ncbi:MAG: excinuclease ABC subunit B, partial [Parcubacteria group bacterium Greene0416_79]
MNGGSRGGFGETVVSPWRRAVSESASERSEPRVLKGNSARKTPCAPHRDRTSGVYKGSIPILIGGGISKSPARRGGHPLFRQRRIRPLAERNGELDVWILTFTVMNGRFKLKSKFKPAGDQPHAIKVLVEGLRSGRRHQTLLGVTGSGKTFTVANVIEAVQKPALVIAHNKTLAAQLAQEYKEFFPDNAVHYFVSYYDYYQPEAYMPITDTYIEKEAQINEEIERLRHASTQALLTRQDVIIVASVSCIYGLGSPEEYEKVHRKITKGMVISRGELIRSLIGIHYTRTTADLSSGMCRALGTTVEVMPQSEREIYRIEIKDDAVARIQKIDSVSRKLLGEVDTVFIFPAKHFITAEDDRTRAIETIKLELKERLKELEKNGKVLEAERLRRRTTYDLAMIREIGYCNGIENYSRHFSGKLPGEPPDTLLSYFEKGRRSTQIQTQMDADERISVNR